MIKELIIFAVGAGIGTAVTHIATSNKYKRIIEVEIANIRDSYDKRIKNLDDKAEEILEAKIAAAESANKGENALKEMAQKYTKLNEERINYSEFYNKSNEDADVSKIDTVIEAVNNIFDQHGNDIVDEEVPMDRYEIPPYAFFDDEQYEKKSFIFTKDNFLIDEYCSEIGDADNQIGNEILEIFASDPDETELYVRNDALETDYEIIKDNRSFDEFDPSEKEDID